MKKNQKQKKTEPSDLSSFSKSVIYYIYTKGCGPCSLSSPVIDTIISIGKYKNIEKYELNDFTDKFGNHSIQTPAFIIDGEIMAGDLVAPLMQLAEKKFNFKSFTAKSIPELIFQIIDKKLDK